MLDAIDRMIEDRHLLTHPFYTRWAAGEVPLEALREYARQYYAFESEFPRFLSAIHTRIPEREHRQLVLDNLWDEEHGPENHAELWLRFAEALGVARHDVRAATANAATDKLLATYRRTAEASPAAGLAALYAYESQVPAVAEEKVRGLRRHYGITDPRALAFFHVHMEADTGHAAAERQLITELDRNPQQTHAAAEEALDAWWSFLSAVDA